MTTSKAIPARPVTVGVIDNDYHVRNSITAMALSRPMAVVATAESVDELIATSPVVPDVVLLDLYLGKGDNVAVDVKSAVDRLHHWGTLVIVHTKAVLPAPLQAASRHHPDGFVLKPDGEDELYATIQAVVHGDGEVSSSWAQVLLADPGVPKLSPRQREILELVADGSEANEIAAELFIAPGTVRKTMKDITAKYRAVGRLGPDENGRRTVQKAREDGTLDAPIWEGLNAEEDPQGSEEQDAEDPSEEQDAEDLPEEQDAEDTPEGEQTPD